MEERYTPPGSPEVARPVPAALPRTSIADALTQENLRDNHFVGLGRDVHSVMIDQCPTIRDAVSLASCCFTLWSKSQAPLFNRLLREASSRSEISGLGYLADMIAFNPILRRFGVNYQHLATILTRARTLLDTMVRTDPYCAWKIAAICGLKHLVKELLGSEVTTKVDPYGRGVLAYYALGGQLDCIKEFIEEHGLEIPLDPRTLSVLARMAAIGGHIPVLEYLRDTHGFKLNYIYPDDPPETLLRSAVMGGNKEMVAFLKKPEHEIDLEVDQNLALVASGCGHWALYEELAQENDPIDGVEVATVVAQDAVRYGNLRLALQLLEEYPGEEGIDPKDLALDVLNGGDPKTFWYALKHQWFTLEDTFENGATVQHILARQGHTDLLKAVLKHKNQKPKAAYVLDDFQQTPLHYAAAGGQWATYCYLLKHYYENEALPQDAFGSSVAHCAAGGGAVWFLKQLFKSERGPELIRLRDRNDAPILFDAANSGEAQILVMIIEEFGIDVKSTDRRGNTVLHVLAKLAEKDLTFWDVVEALVARYPQMKLLDIPNNIPPNNGKTVRQLIAEGGERVNFSEHLLVIETEDDEATVVTSESP